MRRILLAVLFLFTCALPAAAQFDLVTGQVVDPNGTPYSGATVRAQLAIAGAVVNGQPTVTNPSQAQCISAGLGNAPCQMPFQGTQSFTLDSSGNIPNGGISLANNPTVTPASTQWLFSITISPGVAPPLGTGPQSFSIAITISTNPQAIGATLSAAAPKLANITATGGGVSSVNTLTGAITFAAGSNITLTPSGNTITIASTATGGVASFSAGTLSPLFTTSVATPTTTPALSFVLSNAAQNSIFAGPPTGGSGAPSYQTAPTFSAANLTSFPTFNQSTTGNAATATAFATTPSQCASNQLAQGIAASGAANCTTAGASIGLTAGFFPKAGSSTLFVNSLCDESITTLNEMTCADTAGIASPFFSSTSPSAGFIDLAQGSTSVAVNLCATSNSICEQAPTSVTSYLVNKPGNAANGVETNVVTSAVDTQGFSGDANHSTVVTISSATPIGPTPLCSTTNCPAGTYQINGYLDVTTACSTTGGYFVSITYTDDAGSKTVVMPLIGTGVTASLLTATGISSSLALSSTSNFAQGDLFVRSTGTSPITYTTTASACATGGPAAGKLYLSVVPVQ
jgi:hypothetical protein